MCEQLQITNHEQRGDRILEPRDRIAYIGIAAQRRQRLLYHAIDLIRHRVDETIGYEDRRRRRARKRKDNHENFCGDRAEDTAKFADHFS